MGNMNIRCELDSAKVGRTTGPSSSSSSPSHLLFVGFFTAGGGGGGERVASFSDSSVHRYISAHPLANCREIDVRYPSQTCRSVYAVTQVHDIMQEYRM